jgi:hypothetical protein
MLLLLQSYWPVIAASFAIGIVSGTLAFRGTLRRIRK